MGNAAAVSCEEHLSALDRSCRLGDHETGKAQFQDLCDFVNTLSDQEREALSYDLPAWSNERRQQLKLRWHALDAHQGSWAGWSAWLKNNGAAPSHDMLLQGARDLVYLASPGAHRRALWRFCAGCEAADDDHFTKEIESLLGEDVDRSNVEQMWLDVVRAPRIAPEQQVSLVRILRVHCARQRKLLEEEDNCGMQYVQGMHMLAACSLWAGLDESEALRVLEFVLSHLCGDYYSDPAFVAFGRDVRVVEALIEERLPHVSKVMKEIDLPAQVLTFDPLFCLFSHHAPGPTAMRLWDVLLVEQSPNAIFALLLLLLERILPEEVLAAEPNHELLLAGLSTRFAELSAEDIEQVVTQARDLLDGTGSYDFRQRVQELREQGGSPQPGWLGQPFTQLSSWWAGAT